MRRGRAPSPEPRPQWDDPNGQLPGTGIPGDTGDSLYRSSSLRRRRDASPVRGTVESVGQEGVGVVPERPSLFSTSGSSSFNPFSAALSSLRPEERAEVNQTGVSDALQRYANQEMRRLFAEHLRSLPQEPISSSFDLSGMSSRVMSAGETAQGSGVAGGTSQVFHIGTPSGSENTGSSIFQSIPSQRFSIPSHPTSSPISFGPSTPVMSASAAPAGLLSSPGGMSDVGGVIRQEFQEAMGYLPVILFLGCLLEVCRVRILDEFQYQLKLQLFLHLLHQELEIHLHRYWLDRVQ